MKIRATQAMYILPRITEGLYSQEEVDSFLTTKVEKGDVFGQIQDGSFVRNGQTDDIWVFDQITSDKSWFEVLEP